MSRFTILVLCVLAGLIQTALCGCNQNSCGSPGLIGIEKYGSSYSYGSAQPTASYAASYGGSGTGQVSASGNIGAAGQTVVVGSVPVLGSVKFNGKAPAKGSVCITGQCGCGCY